MEKEYIFQASEFPGETTIENLLEPETPSEIINKLATRLFKVFTFKTISIKNLIVFGVIAVIWVVLTLLPHYGHNPFIVKILSFLTFSQGGASNSAFRIFGGLVGKSVFLIFITTFLDGSIKKIHQGIKPFIRGLKQKNKNGFFYLFLGIGIANILFNFFVGYAAVVKSIIGIIAFLLVLLALKSTRGFIYRIILACVRKYGKKTTSKIEENTNTILSGLGVGFLISLALSFIPYGYTPYFVGLMFLLISILLLIIDKTITKKAVIVVLLIMLAPLFSFKIYANDELKGQWVYKKTVVLDFSKDLKEYYKNNEDDKTRISYEIKKNKVDLEFNYLGEGLNADLYDEALENPDDYTYIDIILPNENFKMTFNLDKPKKSFSPGDEVLFSSNLKTTTNNLYYFKDTFFYTGVIGIILDAEAIELEADDFFEVHEKFELKEFFFFEPVEYSFEISDPKKDLNFKGVIPKPIDDKDVLIIEYGISFYINDYFLDNNYYDDIEEEYFYISINYFYQWEKNVFSSIGGLGEDFPGEEEDLTVTSIVLTSTFGVFLAGLLAGIGALQDDENADFIFYLQKDFDNILENNDEEKIINVKIAERIENDIKPRGDLTQKIDITSNIKGFKIISKKIVDEYMEVRFKLRKTHDLEQEGIITFEYECNDKIIENKIIFLLKEKNH